jgi:hypothetical protein
MADFLLVAEDFRFDLMQKRIFGIESAQGFDQVVIFLVADKGGSGPVGCVICFEPLDQDVYGRDIGHGEAVLSFR